MVYSTLLLKGITIWVVGLRVLRSLGREGFVREVEMWKGWEGFICI